MSRKDKFKSVPTNRFTKSNNEPKDILESFKLSEEEAYLINTQSDDYLTSKMDSKYEHDIRDQWFYNPKDITEIEISITGKGITDFSDLLLSVEILPHYQMLNNHSKQAVQNHITIMTLSYNPQEDKVKHADHLYEQIVKELHSSPPKFTVPEVQQGLKATLKATLLSLQIPYIIENIILQLDNFDSLSKNSQEELKSLLKQTLNTLDDVHLKQATILALAKSVQSAFYRSSKTTMEVAIGPRRTWNEFFHCRPHPISIQSLIAAAKGPSATVRTINPR